MEWSERYFLSKQVVVDGVRKINGSVFLSYSSLYKLNFGDIDLVRGMFDCSGNNLSSLEGSPKIVKDDFICEYNKLKTLEGITQNIGGHLFCLQNPLESLKGIGEVGGLIHLSKPLKNCDYFIQYSLMGKIKLH